MILLVGLGNPDKKYQNTRHNIGFRIIDNFAQENNFPEFRLSPKFKAETSEGNLNGKKILLAKPQTFMNESGKSVKILSNFSNTTRTVLVVIHDDIDLPLGKIKVSENRGSAGHKGVQSIIDELKTKNFLRFRIGIKTKQSDGTVYQCEDFVLQKFTKEEEKILKEIIKKTCKAIDIVIKQGIEKAMAEYNKS